MTKEQTVAWLVRLHGPCSPPIVVHRSGLSRKSVVAALGRLRKKGFVNEVSDWKPRHYRMTNTGREWLGYGGPVAFKP
jgi:predicted transcriptional regulator